MSRLDQALVDRGLCPSREKAKRLILAGKVRVNGQSAGKPGDAVREKDELSLIAEEKYVSRGGYKLEHALREFHLEITGLTALDLGASTGGFTDCLLQHGAAKIFAIDVGQGQLAWSLRKNPRVYVMEKTNARHLTWQHFPKDFSGADLAVIDCSFISLQLLIPQVIALLRPAGKIIALLKPQFEAGKAEADKGHGVILDPAIHDRVIGEFQDFINRTGVLAWKGMVPSPLLGPAGNKEFLILIEKKEAND